MARKVISIVLYIVAGFFVYTVSLLAFINISAIPSVSNPPAWIKFAILSGVFIPAMGALLIGLVVSRFENWKRDTGIVLVSGAGMTAFVVFATASLLWSPDIKALFPPYALNFFSDFADGAGCIVMLSAAGAALILISKRGRERG